MGLKQETVRKLFIIHNDLFKLNKYNNYSLVILENLHTQIVDYFHESFGHISGYKLYKLISHFILKLYINKSCQELKLVVYVKK